MTMRLSELAATVLNTTSSALAADNDLCVASATIAAYDYLVTLPAEYRLYKSSNRQGSGLVLFVLIRYTSVIVLVVSNVGFFYHGFTTNTCDHFHLAVSALNVVQIMVSQAILAIRTYNISQREPWVGWTLLSTYVMVTGFQWFSILFSRMPVIIDGNCTSASAHPQQAISTWSFYLIAMLFDCLTLSISTFYLMKARAAKSAALWLVKIILYDGLGYFIALMLMNATNIFLFRNIDNVIQTTGASLGYLITWIMSQRLLIHLHEARAKQKFVVVAQPPTSRAIMSPLRCDGEAKHKTTTTILNDIPESPDECGSTAIDFDLRVRIERSIVVDGGLQDKDSDASPKFDWERE